MTKVISFLLYNFFMSNKLIKKIDVKYSEMDHNLALKPFSLLNFLQDIASDSAENLGFGYSYMSKHNYAWFLIKYRMEFNDYPIGTYDLTLITKPRGYNKLFAYRDFELLQGEKLLGKVFSVWSIVDVNSRTTIPIANAISNDSMLPYQKLESDLSFSKIKPVQNVSLEKEFEVRYNDLDVNGHANNGNYIVWAFEPLSLEFKLTLGTSFSHSTPFPHGRSGFIINLTPLSKYFLIKSFEILKFLSTEQVD